MIVYAVTIDKSIVLKYGFTSNFLFYLLGPFIYIYIRRLIIEEIKPYFLPCPHFLPALVYIGYITLHIWFYEDLISHTYLDIFGFIWQITCVASVMIYLVKSNNLTVEFIRNQKLNLSFDQAAIKYVRVMLGVIAMIMGCWFLNLLTTTFFNYDGFEVLFLMWFFYGTLAYIITLYNLRCPQIFRLKLPENKAVKPSNDRLTQAEIHKLQESIYAYIQKEKAYRSPELSLSVMAKQIDTSSNNLSWLLNNAYDLSFYDFINQYRIDEFLEQIGRHEHKELTLISIAEDVGFKSKSTFYKALKKRPIKPLRNLLSKWMNREVHLKKEGLPASIVDNPSLRLIRYFLSEITYSNIEQPLLEQGHDHS